MRSYVAGGAVPGRTGVTLMARLRAQGGQLLTRSSVTGISWRASNLTTGATLGGGAFATQTVHDDLQQNDWRWTIDDRTRPGADGTWGYNWLAVLPASAFPAATLAAADVLAGTAKGETVQADVAFTPASGEEWRVIFRWQQLPVYG